MEEEYVLINEFQASTIRRYLSDLSKMSNDLPNLNLPDDWWKMNPKIVASFKQQLQQVFLLPKLNDENQICISKSQLLQPFLSFLVQLLYHKSSDVRFENLEKELRFLLTILGDISWLLPDTNDAEFNNLMAEFESVANQAGCFLHSLFFSNVGSREMYEGLAAVLLSIHLLKETLNSSDIITPAYATPRTSTINSFLILYSLLNDLEDLLKREDNPIANVKDQIYLLHQGLQFLRSSSIRSSKLSEIGELKELLMRMGDLAHQVEYLITAFLVGDAPLWYVIKRLTYLTHNIEVTSKELQGTIAERDKFGGLKLIKKFSLKPPSQDKTSSEACDVVVGFDDKERDILDQLVGGGTESLQVILIWGMPGLGKTTLAKKLYNHPLVTYRFDRLSWCTISQSYDRRSILCDILIHVNSELGKDVILKMEEMKLEEHIYKTLKGRRYLVTMDDVWDSNVWYELQRCFPDDGNGSRILLTSRNKDVAPPRSVIHELPFLSGEQCWELLEKKVFGYDQACAPQLQVIGKKIAAKCCGLPLTVVVIAGILSGMDEEISGWEEVERSLGPHVKDDRENLVRQILELSYKHLPDHLKPCFLSFGEYKEVEKIYTRNLKRLWIAEGFIVEENEKRRESAAEEYLMELIDKSLVIVVERRSDGEGVKACVVHDLLRDLCLKISGEENFIKFSNNGCLSVFEKSHRVQAANVVSATPSLCQHVRSFYGDTQYTSLYVGDMRLLRVLHFNHILSDCVLFGMEYLVNLRFLVIPEVPTWIDRLVKLEYLTVYCVCSLPPSIGKMKKLRYLKAIRARYGEDWNSRETNMSLHYLSCVYIQNSKDVELLRCSPNLRKLKCKFINPEKLKSVNPHFDLRFLTQLHSLSLQLTYECKLEEFGFPSNIRKLNLWVQEKLSWEKMSIIGKLENLQVLKLNLWYLDEEGEELWDTRDGEFQSLRLLRLDGRAMLSQWNVASCQHFPKLQHLILSGCWRLKEIPSEIGEITTLESIQVEGNCPDTLRESARRIEQDQRDQGNEDLRVIITKCLKVFL